MSLKYKILIIMFSLVLFLDQLTKYIVRAGMKMGDMITVIPGYFHIVHVANKGAAFGMFSDSHPTFRVPFFYVMAFIAFVVIVITFIRLPAGEKFLSLVFSLILGGIAGNIVDRVGYGAVTDFLSFHIRDKVADFTLLGHNFNFRLEWPAFNVADSAITIAMFLLVWNIFKEQGRRDSKR